MAIGKRARALAASLAKTIVAVTPRLRPSVRAQAGAVALAGAALTALGAAMVYTPAGVILGGLELALFGLLFIDVDGPKRNG